MQPTTNSKQEQLGRYVEASLRRAETYTAGLRNTYTLLVVGGLLSSAASTLVAGGAAVGGAAVGLSTFGWQFFCILAALLSFATTVLVGVMQQLKLGERLPLGQLCVGRLRALDVALTTGSREWTEIAKEYEVIVKESAEVLS
jgi:hypothetical protein